MLCHAPEPAQIEHPAETQRGLTLIELMVGLFLLAVLAALAAPSFQSQLAASHLSAATSDVLASLMQARTQAIRLGARVTLCPSTSGTDCDSTANTAWSDGWIIFQDSTRSGTSASVLSDDTVLFTFAALTTDIAVEGTGSYVSFAADGQPKTLTGGINPGRLRVCSRSRWLADNARARDLQISANGRIAMERPSNVANTCPFT